MTVIGSAAAANPAAAVTSSWSSRLADVSGGAELAGSGRGVTVAVLDTWVDVSHPDFGGRVERGVTCTGGRCVSGADQPDTCEPHGTHVTGIIASTHYGVAPLARVLPIRVLTDHSGACAANAADVALGIRYAIAHHVKLINVSLGSSYPLQDRKRVLPAAVTAAKVAGDLVVVAAGNGKAAAASTYGDDALTVAALAPDGSIASYSQSGAGVDIAAPGGDPTNGNCDPNVCVVSTWQDGGYASDAGTSMAAPVRQRRRGPPAVTGSAPQHGCRTQDHLSYRPAAVRSRRGTARHPGGGQRRRAKNLAVADRSRNGAGH